jgi:ABC-2 type transport system ATP-binding protein
MPEERGLYKKMKIGEQALYLAQLRGLSKSDAMAGIKEWFVKLEMESWWNKKVEDLSKGMSQKLQFVTTVLHQPKLIILDEPFSGLDPVNSNVIKEEIHELARKGATIIFSTHRMEQVEEICDQIVLVNKGKKILDGTVKDIKQQHKKHLYQIGFDGVPQLTETPVFSVAKTGKDHSVTVKINDGYGPNAVLQSLMQQGATIHSFNELLPSLNDIFIQLVEGTPASRQFQGQSVS